MGHSWTFCNKCGNETFSETARYCDSCSIVKRVAVVGGGKINGLSVAAHIALSEHCTGPMVYMLPNDDNKYIIDVAKGMSDDDIIQKLLTLQEKSIEERKQMEYSKVYIKDEDNPHHGPSKARKGTNKKYVKRKKAANGRSKKRRK
jgi:hypothetical protein